MKLKIVLEVGDRIIIKPKEWFENNCKIVSQGGYYLYDRYLLKQGWIKALTVNLLDYAGLMGEIVEVLDSRETLIEYGSIMYIIKIIGSNNDNIIYKVYPDVLMSEKYLSIKDKLNEYCNTFCIQECQENCPIKKIIHENNI